MGVGGKDEVLPQPDGSILSGGIVDSTKLAPLTKFGYLKELLERHMSKDIDGLQFTEEGYQNAKAILEAEYGQPTEIVNAYIKNIMELPIITGANPRKVKDPTYLKHTCKFTCISPLGCYF